MITDVCRLLPWAPTRVSAATRDHQTCLEPGISCLASAPPMPRHDRRRKNNSSLRMGAMEAIAMLLMFSLAMLIIRIMRTSLTASYPAVASPVALS